MGWGWDGMGRSWGGVGEGGMGGREGERGSGGMMGWDDEGQCEFDGNDTMVLYLFL